MHLYSRNVTCKLIAYVFLISTYRIRFHGDFDSQMCVRAGDEASFGAPSFALLFKTGERSLAGRIALQCAQSNLSQSDDIVIHPSTNLK